MTAGRVFCLAKRFVGASRGTAVRLSVPPKASLRVRCDTTHVPCGLLKSEQTAMLNDRPPDERYIYTIASPPTQRFLKEMLAEVPLTVPTERQTYCSPTAPPRQSQTHRNLHTTTQRHTTTTLTTTHVAEAERAPVPTVSPAHEHNIVHCDMNTDHYKHRPLPPPLPMSQNERRRDTLTSPFKEKTNHTVKATPPLRCPATTCGYHGHTVSQTCESHRYEASQICSLTDVQAPQIRSPTDTRFSQIYGLTVIRPFEYTTSERAPVPTDSQAHKHNTTHCDMNTDHYKHKPLPPPLPLSQNKRRRDTLASPFKETTNHTVKTTPPLKCPATTCGSQGYMVSQICKPHEYEASQICSLTDVWTSQIYDPTDTRFSQICGLTDIRPIGCTVSRIYGLTDMGVSQICGLTNMQVSQICGLTDIQASQICSLTDMRLSQIYRLTDMLVSQICGLTDMRVSQIYGLTDMRFSQICGLTDMRVPQICNLTDKGSLGYATSRICDLTNMRVSQTCCSHEYAVSRICESHRYANSRIHGCLTDMRTHECGGEGWYNHTAMTAGNATRTRTQFHSLYASTAGMSGMSESEEEDSPGMDLISQMIQGYEETLQEAVTFSIVVWPDHTSPQIIEGWGGDRGRNVNAITKGMKSAITGSSKGPSISSHPHHINIIDKLDGTPSFQCMRINFESRADRNLFCQVQLISPHPLPFIAPLPLIPTTLPDHHLSTIPPVTTLCHHLLPPHQTTTPCHQFTQPPRPPLHATNSHRQSLTYQDRLFAQPLRAYKIAIQVGQEEGGSTMNPTTMILNWKEEELVIQTKRIKPTQSISTQSIPSQHIPTQSIPTQSIPTQSIPTQSIPTQPFNQYQLSHSVHTLSVIQSIPTQPIPSQSLSQYPLNLYPLSHSVYTHLAHPHSVTQSIPTQMIPTQSLSPYPLSHSVHILSVTQFIPIQSIPTQSLIQYPLSPYTLSHSVHTHSVHTHSVTQYTHIQLLPTQSLSPYSLSHPFYTHSIHTQSNTLPIPIQSIPTQSLSPYPLSSYLLSSCPLNHSIHTHSITQPIISQSIPTQSLSIHPLSPYPLSPHPLRPYPLSPHPPRPYTLNPHPLNLFPHSSYPLNHSTHTQSTSQSIPIQSPCPYPISPYTLNPYPLSPYLLSPYTLSTYPLNPHILNHSVHIHSDHTHSVTQSIPTQSFGSTLRHHPLAPYPTTTIWYHVSSNLHATTPCYHLTTLYTITIYSHYPFLITSNTSHTPPQFQETKKCEKWRVGTPDGHARLLGYPSIGPGVVITYKARPKMPDHLTEESTLSNQTLTSNQPLFMPNQHTHTPVTTHTPLATTPHHHPSRTPHTITSRQPIMPPPHATNSKHTPLPITFPQHNTTTFCNQSLQPFHTITSYHHLPTLIAAITTNHHFQPTTHSTTPYKYEQGKIAELNIPIVAMDVAVEDVEDDDGESQEKRQRSAPSSNYERLERERIEKHRKAYEAREIILNSILATDRRNEAVDLFFKVTLSLPPHAVNTYSQYPLNPHPPSHSIHTHPGHAYSVTQSIPTQSIPTQSRSPYPLSQPVHILSVTQPIPTQTIPTQSFSLYPLSPYPLIQSIHAHSIHTQSVTQSTLTQPLPTQSLNPYLVSHPVYTHLTHTQLVTQSIPTQSIPTQSLSPYPLSLYPLSPYTLNHLVHTISVTQSILAQSIPTQSFNVHSLSPYPFSPYPLRPYTLNPHPLNLYPLRSYPLNLSTHTQSTSQSIPIQSPCSYPFNPHTLSPYQLSPYSLSPYPLSTYPLNLHPLSHSVHTLHSLALPHDTNSCQPSKVNGKIYTDEAAALGTILTIESFEAVLDEGGDVKNTVMYMVATGPIGDIPLEVKWWTGRMDNKNKPIRELGEMAIADWGEAHRNATKEIQTKHKHENPHTKSMNLTLTHTHLVTHRTCSQTQVHTTKTQPDPTHTILSHQTLMYLTNAHNQPKTQSTIQVLAPSSPVLQSQRYLLQRPRGGRHVQKTENWEEPTGRSQESVQGKYHREREGRRERRSPPTAGDETKLGSGKRTHAGILSAPRRVRHFVELGTPAIRGNEERNQPRPLQPRQTYVFSHPAGAPIEVILIESNKHTSHLHTPSQHSPHQQFPTQHAITQHTFHQHILIQRIPPYIPYLYTIPQHILPQHTSHKHSSHQHNPHKHDIPQHTLPQHHLLQHIPHLHILSQHSLHQHSSTQHIPPQHSLTQHTPHLHILSQHSPHQHILTQHALPQHTLQQHTLHQHILPQHTSHKHPSPQHNSPQHILPKHILPQHHTTKPIHNPLGTSAAHGRGHGHSVTHFERTRMEGNRFWGERVDHRWASERPTERRDDGSCRQVVPTRERLRNGRRGVPRTSLRSLWQADSGTPGRLTRTGINLCPGGGYQGEGPNMGWQESYGIHEKNRELGEAHACRARVPLHGDWAMCHAEAIKNTLEMRLNI